MKLPRVAAAACVCLLALFSCVSRKPAAPTLQEKLGFAKDAVLAIVHADDLGMQADETAGALEDMAYGLCKSGSALVPAPDFPHFAKEWAAHPEWDVGVHVDFTAEWEKYGWPAKLGREKAPSLHDGRGFLWKSMADVSRSAKPGEAIAEMEAQIDAVYALGLSPSHIDAHMGSFFLSNSALAAAIDIAARRNLIIACAFPGSKELFASNGLVAIDSSACIYGIDGEEEDPGLRAEAYKNWMKGLKPGVHYLATHPARVTPELEAVIEMPWIRSGDLSFWTDPETKAYAESLGIRFIGLRELQAIQAKMPKPKP